MLKDKKFYKGINLGGWLSQCDYTKKHMDSFITEKDFKTIASWGFDHVRLPFDYNILEDKNGNYIEEGFERIDKVIEYCHKYSLNTVLDLHKTAGFVFDVDESENVFFSNEILQERFYRLWEKLSERYGKFHETTMFELLNEVTKKEYSDTWNNVMKKCIARIRKNAPDTIILCGSHSNNRATAIADLEKPFDDKCIFNFHCYEPLVFTHQGATWTDKIDPENRLNYAESGCDTDFFEEEFKTALESAKKHNTVLYCGEYGVIDRVPPKDLVAWYHDINSVFEKYGIARCTWNYKEKDFGFSDSRLDNIRTELLNYI